MPLLHSGGTVTEPKLKTAVFYDTAKNRKKLVFLSWWMVGLH